MTQNPTFLTNGDFDDLESGDLTVAQLRALAALITGATITEAATQAEVDRSTVHRWLRTDWHFLAAYNRCRRELQELAMGRLLGLAGDALDTVRSAVAVGDIRAALAVLKGLGFLSGAPPTIGADDPDVLQEEAEKKDQLFHERWLKVRGLRSSDAREVG